LLARASREVCPRFSVFRVIITVGILSDAQNEAVKTGLLALHEELARDITVFMADKVTYLSTDAHYSGVYRRSLAQKQVKFSEKVVKARVYYSNTELNDFSVLSANLDLKIESGKCVIRVLDDGYEFLKEAKEVVVDGKKMTIESASKPVGNGVFNQLFWDFVLQPITEEV
jgi:hypothetical protein